ncbi:MAG: glutathione ABC transporter permease [Armatimonadota bacterium]|nr:MAG: glutathione ABC transporter permease [Armatimonadota bacterium]
MARYIASRLLQAIPTLLLISFLTFIMGFLAPGDPIRMILGEHSDPQTVAQVRHELGLDQPWYVQYGRFVWSALKGDFGISLYNRRPVGDILQESFPATATLAVLAILLAVVIGIPAGIVAAVWHNRLPDRLSMTGVVLGISVPNFVLATLLILLVSVRLGWLPVAGWGAPEYLVLPVLVLAARPAASIARFTRTSMLEVLQQDYIRTARAKGVPERAVILKHALPNALLPVVTVIGNAFGYLLTGSFIVETVFAVPGVGYKSIEAILRRDYPVIQAATLLFAFLFIVVNLTVDILYTRLDPRVRFRG